MSDGQREVANFGLLKYRSVEKKDLPLLLTTLLVNAVGTITEDVGSGIGETYIPVTNFLDLVNVQYAQESTNNTYYPCRIVEYNSETFWHYHNNSYTAPATTDPVAVIRMSTNLTPDSVNIFLYPLSASVLGGYKITYLIKPTEIASGTEPVLPAFTHEAIVQYAYAFILGKDMRTQEATVEYQKFQDYLTRLV